MLAFYSDVNMCSDVTRIQQIPPSPLLDPIQPKILAQARMNIVCVHATLGAQVQLYSQ